MCWGMGGYQDKGPDLPLQATGKGLAPLPMPSLPTAPLTCGPMYDMTPSSQELKTSSDLDQILKLAGVPVSPSWHDLHR